MKSLFNSKNIACTLSNCSTQHQPSGCNQSHKEILINRQFMFSPNEKPQSGMQPGRLLGREKCNILHVIFMIIVAPGYLCTCSTTTGDAGSDSFVESSSHQRCFAVT